MSGESFVPVQAFPTLVTPNVANVDVFQMADGTVRQVMVIGDPNIQANVAPVDPTFGLAIDIKRSVSSTVLGGSADNSANLSTKLPVIPARANSSAPSWSEGFQVPLSVDLSGALRVSGASGGGVAQNQVRNSLNAWVDVGFFPGDAPLPVQVQNGLTILSMPSVTVLQGTSPWVTSGGSSGGVTPVLAATVNGLTINGTVTVNQGIPLAPTLANAWPVNVISSVPNLTLTSLPTVTVTGTVNANITASVPNLTLTSIPAVTQGTTPWVVTNLNGNTISALQSGAWSVTALQGTPLAPTVPNAWPVNVVSSVPNLTITSMPAITVSGTITANQGTPTAPTLANAWPVNVVSSVPNLTLTSLPTLTINTPTVNQGTPAAATLANSWPVNVVSSVPNLTLTSLPTVTINTPTVNQGTAGTFGSPWPVTNLQGNTITVLSTVAANLQATANQGTPLAPTVPNAWPVNVVSSVPNLTITSMPNISVNPGTTISVAKANAAAPTYVEGVFNPLSVDLSGALRVSGSSGGGVAQTQVRNSANVWVDVGYQPVPTNLAMPVQVQNGLTILSIPAIQTTAGTTITALQGTPLPATLANAWPVNVVSSVPNLTITSMPAIAVTPGTTITALGAVTLNPPVYGTGTGQPLSLDTAGNLRVSVLATVPNLTITSLPNIAGTVTANQGTPLSPTLVNSWPVNVVSSVPNLTLTSLPIITINTPTVNQGTAGAFTSPWPVTNLQGNTITVLSATAANLQATVNQGTPLAPTLVNAWPVNVVSSVPNLTITSMPNISVNPGTTISVAKATAASPTYVEGVFNPLSVDLTGALRVSGSAGGGVAQTQVRNSANAWIDVGYQPSPTNLFMPVQVMNGLTILSMPSVTVLQGTSPWVTSGGGGGGVTPVIAATSNGLTINGLVTVVGNTITALGSVADNASNPSTKIPTLPARANASAPTWGEGNVVPLSVDTSGALRVSGSAGGGVADLQVRDSAGNWADVGFRPTDKAVPIVSASVAGLTIVGNITNNSGAPGSNNLGVLPAVANANFVSYNEGNEVFLSTNLKGQLRVDATVNSLTITSMPAVSVTPGTTITIWPSTNNGVLTYNSFSVTSTPVQIKTVPGQVYGWSAMNLSGALRVIRVYDKATIPVLSTDIPTLRIPLPPGGVSNMAVSAIGATYNSGIGVAATTALIDFDTSTPGACDVVLSLFYR